MDGTTPRRRLPLGPLAAAALLAAAASVTVRERAPVAPGTAAPPPPPTTAAPGARPPSAPPEAAPPGGRRSDEPRLPLRIEALARRAIDRYVDEAGLAGSVDDADRAALVMALGRVRESSRWMQRHGRARGPAAARRREAVLEADRTFRETLGVGVSEFVAALRPPGTIEDLGAARQ